MSIAPYDFDAFALEVFQDGYLPDWPHEKIYAFLFPLRDEIEYRLDDIWEDGASWRGIGDSFIDAIIGNAASWWHRHGDIPASLPDKYRYTL